MVKPKTTSPTENFEQAIAELESIVAAMERDDLPLEQALINYERGVALLRLCQGKLTAAEQKIKVLEGTELVDLPTEQDQ
jgi:exodeoxyribonuclease VII small subunit